MFVAYICTSNNFFFILTKCTYKIYARDALDDYRFVHVHTTYASKHAHAAEPSRPGQPTAPVAGRRLLAVAVIAQEMELVGQRTRDNEAAALALRTVGAAGVPLLRRGPLPRLRRRAARGGHEVVVHRPSRCPPLLDRAVDERDEPLHPHLAVTTRPLVCKAGEQRTES